MAAGIPVICNIRDDLVELFPEPPPVIRADPDNLKAVLEETLLRKEECVALSAEARAYVEKHHSAQAAARRAANTYQRILGSTGEAIALPAMNTAS